MGWIDTVSADTAATATQYNNLQARIIQELTTTERDTNTASLTEGKVFYNTTLETHQYKDNAGNFQNLRGAGGANAIENTIYSRTFADRIGFY